MEAFLIVALIALVALGSSVVFLRRAARGRKIDPEAIKRTRLSGDGGGWLYNDNWPGRRKKK